MERLDSGKEFQINAFFAKSSSNETNQSLIWLAYRRKHVRYELTLQTAKDVVKLNTW